jgi:hypothetical protein
MQIPAALLWKVVLSIRARSVRMHTPERAGSVEQVPAWETVLHEIVTLEPGSARTRNGSEPFRSSREFIITSSPPARTSSDRDPGVEELNRRLVLSRTSLPPASTVKFSSR